MSRILTKLCFSCSSHNPIHSRSSDHFIRRHGISHLKFRFSAGSDEHFRAATGSLRHSQAPSVFLLVGYTVKRLIYKMAGLQPTLETLNFDNLVLRSLPVDPNEENTQRQVLGACFSRVSPTPVVNPSLVGVSLPALELLDLSEDEVRRPEFVEYFSGNKILPGSETAAHCYCGHQFGYFSGQLGDGAAMYLGEIVNRKGERWEIQLKGAGLTPFSRTADGRKVLRSSVREFLCSEAFYYLGIPTTRAGSCITSDSKVIRDIFYDGNPIQEKCTLVLRIAPTFLRFGSFEIFKPTDEETARTGPSVGRKDILITMLDYTVKNFYPEIWTEHSENKAVMYIEFYREIVRRTARLVVEWQCVGWCHGVLNTDNMSIVGVTIDYGPYGFMDKFDPNFICNGSDDGGRYTYMRQPEICKWNCLKLAEAIQDVVPLSETKPLLDIFDEEFGKHYKMKMRQKFGLKKEYPEDGELVQSFLDTLHETGADFTNCFRHLSNFPFPGSQNFSDGRSKVLKYLLSQSSSLEELQQANRPRMDIRQLSMFMMISQSNPELLSAFGRSTQLLEREIERIARFQDLKESTEQKVQENSSKKWNSWLDRYEERLKKEQGNEDDLEKLREQRVQIMNSVNPRFILRNYVAQNAISAAEKGDYSEIERVLKLLESPYSDDPELGELASKLSIGTEPNTTSSHETGSGESCQRSLLDYLGKPPAWAADLRVT